MPLKINNEVESPKFEIHNYKCVKQIRKRSIFIMGEYVSLKVLPQNVDVYSIVGYLGDQNDKENYQNIQLYMVYDPDVYVSLKSPSEVFRNILQDSMDESWNWTDLLVKLNEIQENTYKYLISLQ